MGKRTVDAGQVRLRKIVRTEIVNQPVEVRHEDVVIERVAAGDVRTGTDRRRLQGRGDRRAADARGSRRAKGCARHRGGASAQKTAQTETQTGQRDGAQGRRGSAPRRQNREVIKDKVRASLNRSPLLSQQLITVGRGRARFSSVPIPCFSHGANVRVFPRLTTLPKHSRPSNSNQLLLPTTMEQRSQPTARARPHCRRSRER